MQKVKTRYGTVLGKYKEKSDCTVFKGIPFAKPPVGELRLAYPKAPDPWEGERECYEYAASPVAVLRPGQMLDMSEDCLYLNIWTAAKDADERRPVMVWIFGGGFQGGTGSDPEFNGERLASKGVVTVTINYRVGVLGFFAHPALKERSPYASTGNLGLADQIAALAWIKENIDAFGGDPDNVLIFGQSAGGISCRSLLTSDLAAGLFHKAIIQSGGGLNEADPVYTSEELSDIGMRALTSLNWTIEDVLTRDAKEVNDKVSEAAKLLFDHFVVGVFQPCIDHAILKEVPGVAIKKGNYHHDVDVMCGTVCGDSFMFSRLVGDQLGKDDDVLRAFSYSPSVSFARSAVANREKPIWTYYFERTQDMDTKKHDDGKYRYGMNCPHSSEIVYVFGNLDKRDAVFTAYDRTLSDTLVNYWTNFAKTGDPNGENLTIWSRYTEETPYTMHITDDGIVCENIVTNDKAEHVIRYTIDHPGMLEHLDGFFE